VGDAATAHAFSRALFDEGLFATGIGYPTVAQGKARIRTIVTSEHAPPILDRAIEIVTRVAKKMNINYVEPK
jgi:glycine C-acetyltransferase